MGYTGLKHANVTDGSVVDLMVTAVTLDFNNFANAPPIPGKNTAFTQSWDSRIHEVDYVGFADPNIVIEGTIIATNSTNNAGSVSINMGMLASYCTLGSPVTLFDDRFILNPAGSTLVIPQSFKASRNVRSKGSANDKEGERIDYSLTLVETKAWSQ